MPTDKLQNFIENLPDVNPVKRFVEQFAEKFPSQFRKLEKNDGLFSDVLTIAAYSPLLSTTILQNPNYIAWLETQRKSSKVRGKEEILESLARFALTNSTIEPNILLARFRRRELLRIYLQDIRGLTTIAEITEEISDLADAILEHALRIAQQEMTNRYGVPQETDDKGRAANAGFCIVALGKLGSKELNYSSDIDLLFLYSADGETSGKGSRGKVTNREYFVKLSEQIVKLVGAQTGEGAAYRVDMRLRPNGRVGALAISCGDAVRYYERTARDWEKQVLIRSRSCAGDAEIFHNFFESVKDFVFSKNETIENGSGKRPAFQGKNKFQQTRQKRFRCQTRKRRHPRNRIYRAGSPTRARRTRRMAARAAHFDKPRSSFGKKSFDRNRTDRTCRRIQISAPRRTSSANGKRFADSSHSRRFGKTIF